MLLSRTQSVAAKVFKQGQKSALLTVLASAFFTSSVNGCELHARGEGMPSMMGFGFQHPLMQQHMLQTATPVIDMTIAKRYRVAYAKQTAMVLEYSAPPQFHSLSLQVTGSEGVEVHELESEKLGSLVGKEDIVFTARKPGNHTITLHINAFRDDKPVSYSRVVTINAV